MKEFFKNLKNNIKTKLILIRDIFEEETDSTIQMFDIYFRFTSGDATKNEIKEANKQLRDVFRTAGLGTLSVLPFAIISIPILIKLGKFLNVEVLPSSVKKRLKKKNK